jgi:hypothetical protein
MQNRSKFVRAFSTAALLATLAACGGPLRYQVQSSQRAPGADAEVVAHVNSGNNNTRLEIRASNLPPASRLLANGTVFMVWQRRNSSAPWARVGSLNYNEGSRTGVMSDTTVPETRFELQITAETDANVGSPSTHVVFQQNINSES